MNQQIITYERSKEINKINIKDHHRRKCSGVS